MTKNNKDILLDTNILLRFILNDHPQLSLQAKHIIDQASEQNHKLIINHATLAETYFVLNKVYKLDNKKISKVLTLLLKLPNIYIYKRPLILATLDLLTRHNISFIDAYNLIHAKNYRLTLQTFDNQLKKLYRQYCNT